MSTETFYYPTWPLGPWPRKGGSDQIGRPIDYTEFV